MASSVDYVQGLFLFPFLRLLTLFDPPLPSNSRTGRVDVSQVSAQGTSDPPPRLRTSSGFRSFVQQLRGLAPPDKLKTTCISHQFLRVFISHKRRVVPSPSPYRSASLAQSGRPSRLPGDRNCAWHQANASVPDAASSISSCFPR